MQKVLAMALLPPSEKAGNQPPKASGFAFNIEFNDEFLVFLVGNY